MNDTSVSTMLAGVLFLGM